MANPPGKRRSASSESPGSGGEPGRRLPPSRAFVVQLPDGDLGNKPSRGRVEHVRTGRNTRFDDLDRLAAFFAEVLNSEPRDDDDR